MTDQEKMSERKLTYSGKLSADIVHGMLGGGEFVKVLRGTVGNIGSGDGSLHWLLEL